MISDDLKNILNKITKQGKMHFLEGATAEQILTFEKKNSITLPTQYKEWLAYSDGGELFLPAGVQFYGVAHNPIINVDDSDKPSEDYIVIGALSSGDPILCETKGEQIAIYNHEAGRIEDDEVYQNFLAFLSDLYEMLGIGG